MDRRTLVIFLCAWAMVGCGEEPDNSAGTETTDAFRDGVQNPEDESEIGDDEADNNGADDIVDDTQNNGSNDSEPGRAELETKLTDWLAGTFDSAEQARSDQSFFNISLISCRVTAPEFGTNVLYIEQASADRLASPYRQRLYVVSSSDDGPFTSTVYALKDPDAAVGLCGGLWSGTLTASDVELRTGCQVYLEWVDGRFVGGTQGKDCGSTLGGAAYATSEVEIQMDRITSWDRGYDSNDVQVWGAEVGPYVFLRKD